MTTIRADGCVEFRFFRPCAHRAAIAGDFSAWRAAIAMEAGGGGWWSAIVPLERGEYRFRYVADGQWFTDYAANGIERIDPGRAKRDWNSILIVPERPEPMIQDNLARSAA